MSEDHDPASQEELDRYRKQARDVRKLIESGAFNSPQLIEDLRQLAAWYEALAENHSAEQQRRVKNPIGPLPALRSGDETPPSASGEPPPSDGGGETASPADPPKV